MTAHTQASAGARFRQALVEESPLQVVGTINANHALLAKRAGYRAIYLSGGGVAAGSLGLPDLGISGLDDVLTDVRRITDVCDVPLLVDVDTGFGASAFNVARTTKSLIKFLSEEGIRQQMLKTEGFYLQDNKRMMPEADEELFFVIDEKQNQVELNLIMFTTTLISSLYSF